jgi:TolB protein
MMRSVILATALFVCGTAADRADEKLPAIPDDDLQLTYPSIRHQRHELISVDLKGENEERLRETAESAMAPHWSPDGRDLVFNAARDGKPQIVIRNAISGEEKALPIDRGGCPAWSPDGKRIAFQSAQNGNTDIYVINRDGTGLKVVAAHPGYDADPAWSPDGKQILFASSRNSQRGLRVFTAEVDGDGVKELFKDDTDSYGWIFADMSPDGKQIAYGSIDGTNRIQLKVYDIASGSWSHCTDGPGIHSYARWSPDGRYIAYVAFELGEAGFNPSVDYVPGEPGADLLVYEVATATSRLVSKGDLSWAGPRPCWRRSYSKKSAK